MMQGVRPTDSMVERRWVLAVFCAANLAYLVYDALRFHPLPLLVLLGRVGMELVLATALVLLGKPHPPEWSHLPLLRTACAMSLLGWFAIVVGAGGTTSAYFAMVPAFPLIYVAAFPEDPVGALIAGALDLVGGLVLLEAEGAAAGQLGEWASIAFFLGGAAYIGGVLARRRVARELALEKAGREAVEQLATSEKRRAQSERLALVGRLAAGVAHEINNPLSYLRSNLAWLQSDAGPASEAESREALDDSLAGVTRIAQIVSDLNAFAREVPDALEDCDPGDVIGEALRLVSLRVDRVARLIQRIDEPLPSIRVPRRRLVQALVNLLLNAAEAVERGARPAPGETRWIRIEARRDGEAVEFEVEDNGPGLDLPVREHLFEPFFTTKGLRGTGLGLAVSRENVERCGGSLDAGTGREGGALFTIRIPLAAASATPA
jgi:signal transduction histidine kinase